MVLTGRGCGHMVLRGCAPVTCPEQWGTRCGDCGDIESPLMIVKVLNRFTGQRTVFCRNCAFIWFSIRMSPLWVPDPAA